MWFMPTGNQIIWIRPQFEDAMKNNGIGRWGDEGQSIDPNAWFSIAFDEDNQYWVARSNPDTARNFLLTMSGTASRSGADLRIFSGNGGDPALIFSNYQYITEMVAKREGNAFQGVRRAALGATVYQKRTRYVRQLDASAMTPVERLCEMTDLAITDPTFAASLQKEFGALADPVVLLALAAVLGIFAGVGAGAKALGGAAFAAAVSRLLGITMTGMQVKVYVDLYNDLIKYVYADDQRSFYLGAKTVQKIVVQVLKDIAILLAVNGAISLGAKAVQVLKNLVLRYAPKQWLEAGRSGMAHAQNLVNRLTTPMTGYLRKELMTRVTNVTRLFRRGEDAVFRARSAQNREIILLRGPSEERMAWLTKLRGWLDGKPEWVKVKSWMGWHGLVGFPKTPDIEAIVTQGARSSYPMGNLRGVFDEVDQFIAQHPTCPAYEVPYGKNFVDPVKGKNCFDWDAAGANYSLARGAKLVDIGDRYILVDALGRPICQDLDIGMIYRLGTPTAGAHLPSGRGNPEDNFLFEEEWNYRLFQATGETANMVKHGGAGGSTRHAVERRAAGLPHWTPREGTGFAAEDLYAYLPSNGPGGWTSELYHFKGWAEWETFCTANGIPFGF